MKVVRVFSIIAGAAVLCCGLVLSGSEQICSAQTCDSPVKAVRSVPYEPVQHQPVCPHQQVAGQPCQNCPPYQVHPGFIPQLRQAMQPTYQPYFGTQPLVNPRSQYAPHAVFAAANAGYYQCETAYPKGGTAFPGLRRILCPDQFFMSTTKPAEPIPTYTTRGPRDFFLNDNPSSIGY